MWWLKHSDWKCGDQKLATQNMAIKSYGNQKLCQLKRVGTKIYGDQILVVIKFLWQLKMCGDQNLWWLNSCGDQNHVAIKILWKPNSYGDQIHMVTENVWWPKFVAIEFLWWLKFWQPNFWGNQKVFCRHKVYNNRNGFNVDHSWVCLG